MFICLKTARFGFIVCFKSHPEITKMPNKIFQENVFDSVSRASCSQQLQYSPCTVPNNSFNSGYDFINGAQSSNRNQTSYHNTYPDQLDTANWIPDSRVVADIERGLRFSDKMETIEITSKDLSPASCCSNIDLIMPEFYKAMSNKDNYYNKPAINDSQWYCAQKYAEYPSCAQMNFNNSTFENLDKSSEIDNNIFKSYYYYNDQNSAQPIQQNMNIHPIQAESDCNLYSHYENETSFSHMNQISYSQNESFLFMDINTLEQQTAEGSNDGSDIVVEESDDEKTDYSEDLERRNVYSMNCIVCNVLYTPIGSQFYILTSETPLTMSSQKPVFSKLTEMVGELNNQHRYLCNQCLGIINAIDHLQLKLEKSQSELYSKYEKTCKENNLPQKFCKKKMKKVNPKFKHFCGLHSFKCKVCKKLFSIKVFYQLHMMSHRIRNRLLCEVCGCRFLKRINFQKHQRTHKKLKCENRKMIAAFSCKICNKLFRTKTNLKDHENYCSGNLPYSCEYSNCEKKFATSTKLKNHVTLKHDKKFIAICSICNIGFVKVSDYKLHKISHSTEKKFNCTKCDRSYKTLSNLNHHMKFHNDTLPFICTICNKGFMRKEYLESHVNNHKGVKNFSCQFCEKKFVSQKNLDSHLKYHEGGIKKKRCNVCNKILSTGFEEHVRIHNNLKEFECNLCLMKFNTKGALAKHKKRKHVISAN